MKIKIIMCLAVLIILVSIQPAEAVSYEELGVFFPGLLVNTITGYFSLVTGYGVQDDGDAVAEEPADEGDAGSSGTSTAATEDKFDSDTLKLPPPPPSGINPLKSSETTGDGSESTATLPTVPQSTRPVKEKTIVEFPSTVNCNSDVQKLEFPKYCGPITTPLPPPPPPPPPPPGGNTQAICGDGTCDATEDCSTCTSDCGCASLETCYAGQCIAAPPTHGGTGTTTPPGGIINPGAVTSTPTSTGHQLPPWPGLATGEDPAHQQAIIDPQLLSEDVQLLTDEQLQEQQERQIAQAREAAEKGELLIITRDLERKLRIIEENIDLLILYNQKNNRNVNEHFNVKIGLRSARFELSRLQKRSVAMNAAEIKVDLEVIVRQLLLVSKAIQELPR